MAPRYSIIVPVYNAKRTLRRCVDSILAQTYHNFELILVNDGSTDSSGAIIDEYATQDTRIRAIHKSNGGVSSARNAGLDIARGDYVVFVDSDDYITPPHLSDYQCVSSDVAICGLTINVDGKYITENISKDCQVVDYAGIGPFINECSKSSVLRGPYVKAFNRNIIESHNIRFDLRLNWGEDYLFVLECLSHSRSISIIPNSTYVYYCDSIMPGKYKMGARQFYLYVTLTERILKDFQCHEYINVNRLWAYQTMLGYFGCISSMSARLKEYASIMCKGLFMYFPRPVLRQIKSMIELTRILIIPSIKK